MVLYVMKWDIHPDKKEAYVKWADSVIQRLLAVKGVIELRVYRGAVGAPYVVVTYEFADKAAWAAWHDNEHIYKVFSELHNLALNVTSELWGPSPAQPEPIRPGK